jgi:hypothetical protein
MARRQPPAARFDCHPDPCWRLACRALYGAALAAIVFSLAAHAGWTGAALTSVVAVALLIPWCWPRAPLLPSRLRWDGQAWWLGLRGIADEQVVQPEVVLDFGGWMLLRLRRRSAWRLPVYLALRRRDQGLAWAQLRVLLWLARTGDEAGDSAPPT